MKSLSKTYSTMLLTIIIISSFYSFKNAEISPVKNWFIAGSDRSAYEIGIVEDAQRVGKVAYLKSINPKIKNKFGTIMQTFSAENYLDKKLKLSGYIKTQDVKSWVGMWMRVDGEKGGQSLSFDNMGDRKIKGNTEWTKYEIVLDVPKNSTTINYGVLLDETGMVWLDDLTFEVVEKSFQITGKTSLKEPSNTSFEN